MYTWTDIAHDTWHMVHGKWYMLHGNGIHFSIPSKGQSGHRDQFNVILLALCDTITYKSCNTFFSILFNKNNTNTRTNRIAFNVILLALCGAITYKSCNTFYSIDCYMNVYSIKWIQIQTQTQVQIESRFNVKLLVLCEANTYKLQWESELRFDTV